MLVKSKFLLVQNLVFLCFSWLNHESLIFWGSITPFAWFYPIIFSKRQNFCFLDLVMHVSGCTRTKERPIFDREYCTPFWSFLTLALFFFKLIYMHVQLLSITHITIGYHSDCTRKLITFDQLPFQVLQEWAWSAWPSWMHLLEAQRAFLTLSTAPKGLKNGEQC